VAKDEDDPETEHAHGLAQAELAKGTCAGGILRLQTIQRLPHMKGQSGRHTTFHGVCNRYSDPLDLFQLVYSNARLNTVPKANIGAECASGFVRENGRHNANFCTPTGPADGPYFVLHLVPHPKLECGGAHATLPTIGLPS
jgi:hypothetical protein